MPPVETSWYVLVLAGGPLVLLLATLCGVWLGFRICTRDAALLARFASDAREARFLAEAAIGSQKALREEWEATTEQVERKRAQTRAAQQRAEAANAKLSQAAEEPAPQPLNLSPRERRRQVQRRLNNGGLQ